MVVSHHPQRNRWDHKVGGPAFRAALKTHPCPQSTREHSPPPASRPSELQVCRMQKFSSCSGVWANMRFQKHPLKNSYFSTRLLAHFQILLAILFIFIARARYKETHEQEGRPMTQLNIQGSSWQQPQLASSGAMKYLWCWSCRCWGFSSLCPASSAMAASPSSGVWCRGRRFLSPGAISSTHPPPQLSPCIATQLSPHTQTGAGGGGQYHLCPSQPRGRETPQAKPPAHPRSDHKETGASCYWSL